MKRGILIFGGVVFILVGVLTIVAWAMIRSWEEKYNALKIKPAAAKRWSKQSENGESTQPIEEAQVITENQPEP